MHRTSPVLAYFYEKRGIPSQLLCPDCPVSVSPVHNRTVPGAHDLPRAALIERKRASNRARSERALTEGKRVEGVWPVLPEPGLTQPRPPATTLRPGSPHSK